MAIRRSTAESFSSRVSAEWSDKAIERMAFPNAVRLARCVNMRVFSPMAVPNASMHICCASNDHSSSGMLGVEGLFPAVLAGFFEDVWRVTGSSKEKSACSSTAVRSVYDKPALASS